MIATAQRLHDFIRINHGTHRGLIRYLLGQAYGVALYDKRFGHIQPAAVDRLIFVCLGNINRSAFAAAVAQREAIRCASIGLVTTTGAPASDPARRIAAEFQISLDSHRATSIDDFDRQPGDLLMTMEFRHAEVLLRRGIPAGRIALLGHWARPIRYHIHDPATLSQQYFRSCFSSILPAVTFLADELRRGASPSART